jgi:hypothetical protein
MTDDVHGVLRFLRLQMRHYRQLARKAPDQLDCVRYTAAADAIRGCRAAIRKHMTRERP